MNCSVGEKIRIFRQRQKMSRNELAQIAEISVTTIANYENGKTKPSVKNIVKIALALNVTLNDLLSVRGKNKKKLLSEQLRDRDESLECIEQYLSKEREKLSELSEKLNN